MKHTEYILRGMHEQRVVIEYHESTELVLRTMVFGPQEDDIHLLRLIRTLQWQLCNDETL